MYVRGTFLSQEDFVQLGCSCALSSCPPSEQVVNKVTCMAPLCHKVFVMLLRITTLLGASGGFAEG